VPATILVAESDPAIRRLVASRLGREGFAIEESAEPLAAGRADVVADLVVVEIGGKYGFEPIRAARASRPATMVVGLLRDDAMWDLPGALDAGADDCLRKPFSPAELVSRVRAVLRRRPVLGHSIHVGAIEVDADLRRVLLDDVEVDLTRREYDLVELLAQRSHEIVPRQDLLDQIWDAAGTTAADASLTEHIRRVRAKIEVDPTAPARLVTVRGIGYRLAP
jgi:DNA-binding response OmpR family regulator